MKKILLYCCSILLLLSCKKYGHGYVEGTVYDRGSNKVIEGATVSIFKITQVAYFRGINFHQTTKTEVVESTRLSLRQNVVFPVLIITGFTPGGSVSMVITAVSLQPVAKSVTMI